MNRILLGLVFLVSAFTSPAQKVYFIYIQAEPAQPFYVKLNERIYSSAASGYLVLSKLRDSSYAFSIGFPGNKMAEQKFSVTMDKKDHGYLLKNFGEKGWGLFDLQTLNVQMAAGEEGKKDGTRTENKEVSEFTNVLAKAADDPSLKEKPVMEKPLVKPVAEIKPEEKAPVVVKTEAPKEPAAVSEKKEADPVTGTNQPEKPVAIAATDEKVKPVSEPVAKEKGTPEKTAESPPVVTVEKTPPPVAVPKEEPKKAEPAPLVKEELKQDPPKDPVVVKTDPAAQPMETEEKPKEEPAVVTAVAEPEYKPSVVKRRSESSTTEGFGLTFTDTREDGLSDTIRILIPNPKPVVMPVKDEPREEKKFLEGAAVTADSSAVQPEPVVKPTTARRNTCAALADDNDFLRVRKRMAAVTTDENMIAEAKKIMKTKCFSTAQIRNLGLLFLNDGGRYNFYDAAYAYAADPGNYPSLEAELKDPYYINRFKAMLR